MSFTSNAGKPYVEPRADQCEMVDASGNSDKQCLEPAVGTVPEGGGTRVCAECAKQMQREDFAVVFYGSRVASPGV